jgi:hypothetical protein
MITKPQKYQTCTSKVCLTHSPLLFIRWGASQVQFLIYSNEPILLGHHSENKETCRLPQIGDFILKYRVPPYLPSYKGERRTTFAKAYGIKVRCYRELFGEHVRNLGNSLLLPHPPKRGGKKACMESEQWTVHSPHQTQLEKNPPHLPQPTREKRATPCHFPPWHDFSLLAWKSYS